MNISDILEKIAQVFFAIKPGFSSVYSIWGTILSVLFFYKTIYTLIGVFCTRKFEPAKKYHKYGIVIAARNEQNVIANLLDSIGKQDYPQEYIKVFVVADNCSPDDKTAEIARSKGAAVYERFDDDPEHKTKGYALKFLFEQIEKDYGTQSFEGFFVFDADNLLKSDYISRMNYAFDSGEKIITSFRNSKNFGENWISSTYALHWMRSSRQSHRARSALRLATNIQGTGFLFASEIVKNGWNYTSLTEDRALTADAVVQGYQITYNDAAEFYDEQPTKIKIAMRQRIRWAKGHILAFVESGGKLFKNIFTYKGKNTLDTIRQRFASYDIFFLVLPRPLFSLAKKIIKAIVFIIGYTLSPHFWIWTAVYFIGILEYKVKSWVKYMMIAAYIFVFEHKRINKMSFAKKAWFTFTWPLFDIIGRISTYIALFAKVTWKPIPHDSKVTIEDIAATRVHTTPKILKRAGSDAAVRIVCHCAFAAISIAYSFFMLNINTNIFYIFVAVNVLLTMLHIICELSENTPKVYNNILVLLTYVWNITLCCEVLGNGAISYVFSAKLFLNMMLYASPYVLIFAISNSIKVSAIISSAFWFLTSSANYFLVEMRGRPLFLSDIFSVGTALNVADQYKFDITAFYALTLLYIVVMIAYFGFIEKYSEEKRYKTKWYVRYPICIPTLIVICLLMSSSTFLKSAGVAPYFWSHKVNGFPLNFVVDLKYSSMDEPKGYEIEKLEKLYKDNSSNKYYIDEADNTTRPNVIVIMNESFSDLRVIGDFDTNQDITPFLDSLYNDKNVISGYTYVSVFGGGTADSEYEFLTGDNMFMYSQGSIPYQTNFKGVTEIPSIVQTFDTLDYKTIAAHPYLSSGWNRPNVYSAMGFDVKQFIEDYESPEYFRNYITDKCDFDNIIYQYENKEENTPLFVFNVTMQNHGGYTTSYRNFEQKIQLRNMDKEYPHAEQYLSLLHETDIAVKGLIEYFENVDEPTIICFFGDHQVQIEDEFYEHLYGKSLNDLSEEEELLKYVTRFFIWANYDIEKPADYKQLTALEERIFENMKEPLDDEFMGSDAADSDANSSDICDSDVTDSDNKDEIGDEDKNDNHNSNDVSDSSFVGSDSVGSDIAGSDAVGSDSVTDENVYVTQKKVDSPQVITNLSDLSGILFEACGLPQSPYQKFIRTVREKYPVITSFGVIDSDGVFKTFEDETTKSDEILSQYKYAIYNRVFDKENTIKDLFCLYYYNVAMSSDTYQTHIFGSDKNVTIAYTK